MPRTGLQVLGKFKSSLRYRVDHDTGGPTPLDLLSHPGLPPLCRRKVEELKQVL